MIEYLEQLVQEKQFEKALTYAEQLLAGQNSATNMIMIQCAVLTARVELADYSGAVVAGQIAVHLARENGDWDYFGLACMDLGAAYYYLRQWDQAIHSWLEFLAALVFYDKSAQYEARVRYNLGLLETATSDFAKACRSMEQALTAAIRLGDEQMAHGIRLALIGALLKAGQLNPIPRLLAQCGRYLRRHRNKTGVRDTELWHTRIRIEYTLETDRPKKARRLALRGLMQSDARADQRFAFHMMLARTALRQGFQHEALGHSLAARRNAIQCHRHDLEAEAGDSISRLTAEGSSLMDTLDQYYLSDLDLPIQEELDDPIWN